jgi:N-carbamoylputrescine amidase
MSERDASGDETAFSSATGLQPRPLAFPVALRHRRDAMATLRVTVCELSCETSAFEDEWAELVTHVRERSSQLVLLPEMAFSAWFAAVRDYDIATWRRAVDAHDRWLARLIELAPATVLGTRPIDRKGSRFNEAFVWQAGQGYRGAHLKSFLPDEEEFWEASWYDAGDKNFAVSEAGGVRLGFQICTELWSMEHARLYGKQGVHLIACPRGTPHATLDKWLAGGRASAVVSGAFVLSSNRATPQGTVPSLGGQGWLVGPESDVLARTSRRERFATVEIDLAEAERAKRTYPRYAI